MARLSDPRDRDAPRYAGEQIDRARETMVQRIGERVQTSRFSQQHVACRFEIGIQGGCETQLGYSGARGTLL
jgi:hypothetical protein